MKITAGLGSIDSFLPYIRAGAGEVFLGIVPDDWMRRYGLFSPLNRREVLYYNVQAGSFSELEILHRMQEKDPVPAAITLNALTYLPEQFPWLAEFMLRCASLGFDRFIIADPALLVYLNRQGLASSFHLAVSGELGELNTEAVRFCAGLGADRIIFPRKMSIPEMASMIRKIRPDYPDLEFEAFAMNEMCHFSGCFCNSLHCDELSHICLLPYRLGPLTGSRDSGGKDSAAADGEAPAADGEAPAADEEEPDCYIPGSTGCGLCALYDLQEAGITHLKLVSRGGRTEETIADIRALEKALQLLAECSSASLPAEEASRIYRRRLMEKVFPQGCSRNCYYLSGSPIPS